MHKKKNNALLIALLIVAAMSGSAFAADAVSGSSSLFDASIVLTPQLPGGEALPVTNLVVPQENATEQQTPIVSPSETATQPAIEPQEPAAVEQPVVEQPEGTATSETPITEPEAAVPTEEPAVTEPAITEGEVVTEPAIVVAPEAATLTITQRLIVGDKHLDNVQIVEGLTLGEVIDLQPYKLTEDWLESASDISTVTLSEAQTSILLEYKPVEGFVVVIPEEIPNDMSDM